MAIPDPSANPVVGDPAAAPVPVATLTDATTAGAGVFDQLMRSVKAHLDEEFKAQRIKGAEYATVYLGSIEAAMQTAFQFSLQQAKAGLEIELVRQQVVNASLEGKVLVAQECKLRAEYDLVVETRLKTTEEKTLLVWKTNTEKAQTIALGVDDNSVIGKQKALYGAQADGFKRDAEQKVAKILVDSWNVRRTTDEATVADDVNKLNDAAVGRAVTTLLAGVGA